MVVKKIFCFLIIFLCVLGPVIAVAADPAPEQPLPDPRKHNYKEIKIQGGYESVASINVRSLAIQAEDYQWGMPFPLNDPTAQYGATKDGRLIAKWNVLTNKAFKLDIIAEVMHNYNEEGTADVSYINGLGYKLTFTYELSYFSAGKAIIASDKFTIDVPNSPKYKTVEIKGKDILAGLPIEPNSLVGSAEGDVFFQFDKKSSDSIANAETYANLPEGNYSANVVIVLKVG